MKNYDFSFMGFREEFCACLILLEMIKGIYSQCHKLIVQKGDSYYSQGDTMEINVLF